MVTFNVTNPRLFLQGRNLVVWLGNGLTRYILEEPLHDPKGLELV